MSKKLITEVPDELYEAVHARMKDEERSQASIGLVFDPAANAGLVNPAAVCMVPDHGCCERREDEHTEKSTSIKLDG